MTMSMLDLHTKGGPVFAKTTANIRTERRREPDRSTSLITVAALWPKNGENLGTTLRTCDAVHARMVVPNSANATQAIRRGNTIGVHNSLVDFIEDKPLRWLLEESKTHRVVAVELAYGAIPLIDLAPATEPTILVVGHENTGIPQAALTLCDEVVEIPMEGVGNSLNAAVATALVLYKLRGWA